MEDLVGTYSGARVLVTGHTGFKGAWLCEWLTLLGAKVTGFSRDIPTQPSAFEQLQLADRVTDLRGDVRDLPTLKNLVKSIAPDFVFHLAAQPIVLKSYQDPIETIETNILGTAHILEALRHLEAPCAALIVTSDKCYRNAETDTGYQEEDALGGRDPYSASKACAEILTAAWRSSFFQGHPVRLASARAGNVIGGGDWAPDRLVPDAVRALRDGRPIPVRNPNSVRPWQHVLESLSGYLTLAARLSQGVPGSADAFNFGPLADSHRPVKDLLEVLLQDWPGTWVDTSDAQAPHEAAKLNLDVAKSRRVLQWQPRWNFATAVHKTIEWYRASLDSPKLMSEFTRGQIRSYLA